jgi:hypothetical protein
MQQQPKTEPGESVADGRRWPAAVRRLINKIAHPYRPERHYMRGGTTDGAAERRRASPARNSSARR